MADEDIIITEDIGGVQGTDPNKESEPTAPAPKLGETPDHPAPDAGEIEWSGGLIKKPPAPES